MRSRHVYQACAGMTALFMSAVLSSGGCGKLSTTSPTVVPLLGMDQPNVIKDEYFVILRAGAAPDVVEGTRQQIVDLGGEVRITYESLLVGFAVSLPPEGLEALRWNPNIDYVEADRLLLPTGLQTCAPWNLDRIDQKSEKLDGVYAYGASGAGVDVYVVDTGIDATHPELRPDPAAAGRVKEWINAASETKWSGAESSADCNGHGTIMAGVVAGKTLGVAKQANLFSVRVVEKCVCQEEAAASGSVIAKGIELLVEKHKKNHETTVKPPPPLPPAVALVGFSVGGSFGSLETALNNAIKANVVVVVSAGNDGKDACEFSPAKLTDAITVSAVDANGASPTTRANFGPCVDIFAPGVAVRSAASKDAQCYVADDASGTTVRDGTSIAAAHVAGVAALHIEELLKTSGGAIEGATVWGKIEASAVTGGLTVGPGSQNRALYSSVNVAGTPGLDEDGCNDGLEACFGATCGAEFCPNGAACCGGLGCGAGGVLCSDGECDVCGAREGPCCAGPPAGEPCLGGLECNAEALCSCGDISEPCCAGVDDCSSATQPIACDTTTMRCVHCGDITELCCDGEACNNGALACDAAGECVPCGIQGNPCCGATCTAGLACNSAQLCEPCGGDNELCCGGVACDPGYVCGADGRCKGCGSNGAPCCSGLSCNAGLTCNAGSTCEACGGPGVACCPGATPCAGDMACVGGVCTGDCFIRCYDGFLLKTDDHKLTEGACTAAGDPTCAANPYGGGGKIRVQYNGKDVFNVANCGQTNKSCCDVPPACDSGSCNSNGWNASNPASDQAGFNIIGRSYCPN